MHLQVVGVLVCVLSYAHLLQYVDTATFLHLGFNRLITLPPFGPRAKYNLTVLCVRNNNLDGLDGEYTDCIDLLMRSTHMKHIRTYVLYITCENGYILLKLRTSFFCNSNNWLLNF